MTVVAQSSGLAAGSTTEVVLFVVFGGLAIGAGMAMVGMRNVVHGALMLVINMLSIAGLYLVLESPFLSAVQVLVYAGAVMVLFLFVIMLLGVDRDDLLVEASMASRIAAAVAGAAVVGVLGYGLVGPYTTAASACPGQDGTVPATAPAGSVACVGFADTLAELEADGGGSVDIIAGPLFTRWSFPFEVAALLLTVATLGAMLLGRRKDFHPDDDPAWEPSMVLPDSDPDPVADDGAVADADDDEEIADDGKPVPARLGAGDDDESADPEEQA